MQQFIWASSQLYRLNVSNRLGINLWWLLNEHLANNEDPDEMLHYAAFHPGLPCLLSQNDLKRKKYNFIWKL